MKHLLLFLSCLTFALITSQFSVADAENPAELLKQISSINHTQNLPSNKMNYSNEVDLFANTNPEPTRAVTSSTDEAASRSKKSGISESGN